MPFRSEYPPVPEPHEPIHETVIRAIHRHHIEKVHQPAFINGHNHADRISWGKLYYRHASAAAFLKQHGFKKGDVACIALPNSWHYAAFVLGALANGGIVTGISPTSTSFEMEQQLKDSTSTALLTHEDCLQQILIAAKQCPDLKTIIVISESGNPLPPGVINWTELEAVEPAFDRSTVPIDMAKDLVLLPYSSGTTGPPKGVMITHMNMAYMYAMFHRSVTDPVFIVLLSHMEERLRPLATMANPDLDPNAVQHVIHFLPVHHAYGFFTLFSQLINGTVTVTMKHFEPRLYLENLAKFKARHISAVPPILLMLTKLDIVDHFDLSSIQHIVVGAAPASKELCDAVQARLPSITMVMQGYGMTELTFGCHMWDIGTPFGSVGKLFPNLEQKVVNTETGAECGPNEHGELWVRGPTVMRGYWRRPKETAETIDRDGWLHTGDVVYVDEDNFLFICDRIKELIKVAPAELEAIILEHPQVQDAAVIGIPDERNGELPRAYVVPKDDKLKPSDVRAFVDEKVSHYKRLLGGVEFIREIPKNPSGKIMRRLLRDNYRKNTPTAAKL